MAQGETDIYTVHGPAGFPKADCTSAALGLIPLSTFSLETYQAQTGDECLQTADKPCRVQPASSILTADVQDRIAYRQPINKSTYQHTLNFLQRMGLESNALGIQGVGIKDRVALCDTCQTVSSNGGDLLVPLTKAEGELIPPTISLVAQR